MAKKTPKKAPLPTSPPQATDTNTYQSENPLQRDTFSSITYINAENHTTKDLSETLLRKVKAAH